LCSRDKGAEKMTKQQKAVYEAAMKWHKWASKFFTPETMSYADRRLSKACAAAAIRTLKEKK
jgi:hypothetical protein